VAEPALVLDTVSAGYGPLEILHGLNLTVERGEFVCLLGPNGAGKSTLLKAIFGMCTVTGGSIQWRGVELRGVKPQRILTHGIAYVPQGRCNFPLMTVAENLEMAAYTRRDREVKADEDEVLEELVKAGRTSGKVTDEADLLKKVIEREKIRSTGIESIQALMTPVTPFVDPAPVVRRHAEMVPVMR